MDEQFTSACTSISLLIMHFIVMFLSCAFGDWTWCCSLLFSLFFQGPKKLIMEFHILLQLQIHNVVKIFSNRSISWTNMKFLNCFWQLELDQSHFIHKRNYIMYTLISLQILHLTCPCKACVPVGYFLLHVSYPTYLLDGKYEKSYTKNWFNWAASVLYLYVDTIARLVMLPLVKT